MFKLTKNKVKILIFGLLLIGMLPFINALIGVTAFYWDTNPLVMAPGETQNIEFFIQNANVNKDIIMQVELTEGFEIATLTDPNLEYTIPSNGDNIPVNVRVTIPENTPLNNEYTIKASFRQIKSEGTGIVHLGTRIDKSIPVIINEPIQPPSEEGPFELTDTVLIAILVIIILIGYWVYKKKKY